MTDLVSDITLASAMVVPSREALKCGSRSVSYAELCEMVDGFACGLASIPLARLDRVAVFAEKTVETVAALFGSSRAGAAFVPINPLLKPAQVAYILDDCKAAVLVTTFTRLVMLAPQLVNCPGLRRIVVIGHLEHPEALAGIGLTITSFLEFSCASRLRSHRAIDTDMAAILYTSGSTGKPKGVVLSHRNIVAGARSVATYLESHAQDRVLALLPLSFDYGFSQLTSSFLVGAAVVLHNYLLPGDAIRLMARESITGVAAVPPLWLQLVALEWPSPIGDCLRYFTNSGGAMPSATLALLRQKVPRALPYLMYGLTEAFRSTYLAPEEVDRRPTSIGKAIPNAEVLVVREDGTECDPDEPGELVHRGALVSLGYWNDPVKTAERFRPAPGRPPEIVLQETAVWSGDTVRRDSEGFLYFVSRRDDMIKTSGYRVSPSEVEEAVYGTGLVAEAAAFGVRHPALGQAIVLVALAPPGVAANTEGLLSACRAVLPGFMLPVHVEWFEESLPRNPNGKIDRQLLAAARVDLFTADRPSSGKRRARAALAEPALVMVGSASGARID